MMRYTIEMRRLHGKLQPAVIIHHDDLKDNPRNPRWERVTDWDTMTVTVKYPRSQYAISVKAFNAFTDGTKNPEDLGEINDLLIAHGFEPLTIDKLAA